MLQHAPHVAVDGRPQDDAREVEREERGPGVGEAEGAVGPGAGGEAPGTVGGAEEGFGAGLHEGREGDGEFAHAEPAGAAVDVGCQRCVGDGLGAEVRGVRGEEAVVGPCGFRPVGVSLWVLTFGF